MVKIKFFEAFRSGYASTAVEKIANIIGKRIGQNITVAEEPIEYQNKYGVFAGFFASIGSGDTALRFNFSLGKSDKIVSVDYFGKIDVKPTYTIDTDGYNVVQVIDTIVAVINGDRDVVVEARGRKSFAGDSLMAWVNSIGEKKVLDILQNERLSYAYEFYLDWVNKNREKAISNASFNKEAKKFLNEKGLENKYSRKGTVKKGSTEKLINTDKEAEVEYKKTVQLSSLEKFEQIQKAIGLMKNSLVNSIYLYGQAGTGKTKIVIDTLDKIDVEYELFSGGLRGADELIKLLYTYRDNIILVFDDFDSVMRNAEMKNIMKAALSDDYERYITYVSNKKVAKKDKIPTTFKFTSSVIFISNSPRIDPAIKSRSLNFNIQFSKDELLDLIKESLKNILPSVSMDIKMEVWRFLKENVKNIDRIDFRQFKYAVQQYYINKDNKQKAKRWVLSILNN